MLYLTTMTIHEALQSPINRDDARILLAHVLRVDRLKLVTSPEYEIDPTSYKKFHALVERRKRHEPIAYLIGSKEFFGRRFQVNKWTLIPRPETETLVERIIAPAQRSVIWDVGTGSGCIAVSLACEIPSANVIASDVSARALSIARANAVQHGQRHRITFFQSDLLNRSIYRELASLAKKYSTLHIVANLPYLPESDKQTLAKDVTEYEPHRALFSGAHGNDLIIRLLRQLSRHVHEWNFRDVTIWLECDVPQTHRLTKEIQKIFLASTIASFPDLAGRIRFLTVSGYPPLVAAVSR